MTYTQQSPTGKRMYLLLRKLRARVVRWWLRLFGPRWTVGCLVLLRDDSGRICLLKHRGRVRPWGLPGGIVAWPEAPKEGLVRELHEELSWSMDKTRSGPVILNIVETCVSENFALLELVYSAHRPVSHLEVAAWVPQASEITEIGWFTEADVLAEEGLLERHRSLILRVLRGT